MKKLIDDLLAMQKLDYVPDSMGYQVLDKAIQTLRRHDIYSINNPGAMSGTISSGAGTGYDWSGTVTVGSQDIHWEKHL